MRGNGEPAQGYRPAAFCRQGRELLLPEEAEELYYQNGRLVRSVLP